MSDCDFGPFRDFVCFVQMDGEEIGPDFEVGITDRGESQESRHSTVSSSVDHSEESLEEAKHTTEKRIAKLLKIEKSQSNSPTPPRPQRRKRRRLSRSRSTSPSRYTQKEVTSKKPQFLPPSRVADIFDRKISPQELCSLSALKDGSPAAVFKIIPEATVDQICELCKLWEE